MQYEWLTLKHTVIDKCDKKMAWIKVMTRVFIRVDSKSSQLLG